MTTVIANMLSIIIEVPKALPTCYIVLIMTICQLVKETIFSRPQKQNTQQNTAQRHSGTANSQLD